MPREGVPSSRCTGAAGVSWSSSSCASASGWSTVRLWSATNPVRPSSRRGVTWSRARASTSSRAVRGYSNVRCFVVTTAGARNTRAPADSAAASRSCSRLPGHGSSMASQPTTSLLVSLTWCSMAAPSHGPSGRATGASRRITRSPDVMSVRAFGGCRGSPGRSSSPAAAASNQSKRRVMNPYMPSAGSHSVAVERYRHRWRPQLTCGAPAKRVCRVRTLGAAKGKFGGISRVTASTLRSRRPSWVRGRLAQPTLTRASTYPDRPVEAVTCVAAIDPWDAWTIRWSWSRASCWPSVGSRVVLSFTRHRIRSVPPARPCHPWPAAHRRGLRPYRAGAAGRVRR